MTGTIYIFLQLLVPFSLRLWIGLMVIDVDTSPVSHSASYFVRLQPFYFLTPQPICAVF